MLGQACQADPPRSASPTGQEMILDSCHVGVRSEPTLVGVSDGGDVAAAGPWILAGQIHGSKVVDGDGDVAVIAAAVVVDGGGGGVVIVSAAPSRRVQRTTSPECA